MSRFEEKNLGDLPASLTFGLPVITYFSHFAFRHVSEELYWTRINSELGLTETATLIFLAVAIVASAAALLLASKMHHKMLAWWLVLIVLGSVYFLGEEASWGQHIFRWETPENWAATNDQDETNLHNTVGLVGYLSDQVPRAILTLGAFVFGFCYPAWRRLKAVQFFPSDWRYWFLPTAACITIGFLAVFASVPRDLPAETWPALDLAYGEIKELMLAQFIMIYALSLLVRLRAAAKLRRDEVEAAE